MMKVKVLKKFRDKYTKNLHKAGQEIEITNERVEEINSTSYGVFVKEIKEEKPVKKKTNKKKSTKK